MSDPEELCGELPESPASLPYTPCVLVELHQVPSNWDRFWEVLV